MKSQLKNDVLNFNKASLIELNLDQIQNINGGSSPPCTIFFVITAFGVGVAVGDHIADKLESKSIGFN